MTIDDLLARPEFAPVARVIDDGTPEGGIEWLMHSGLPTKTGDKLLTIDQAKLLAETWARERREFSLMAHLQRQREWSEKTFGPGNRTEGVVDHIRKELNEILAKPDDISEWIDVVILALDGAWRAGASPDEIIAALVNKQLKNELRQWPDWRTAEKGKAIEHIRNQPSSEPKLERDPDQNLQG